MKKKDREENRQKERSKKKKRLNDNRKLLNDRIKWKMQKKNIQESKQKNNIRMDKTKLFQIKVVLSTKTKCQRKKEEKKCYTKDTKLAFGNRTEENILEQSFQ